jgi:glycosyltransferase involved in cell wall biosynthesis
LKVLIVCSGTKGTLSPFIKEQIDSLAKLSIEFSLFQINKRGLFGYLLHLKSLIRTIKQIKPDLIHAHYGLSGLLANIQRNVPVVTTFHGSDINDANVLKYSKWANRLSVASVFVEKSMMQKVKRKSKIIVIPCGVDTSVFYPVSKIEASKKIGINSENLNILFSSAFINPVKNHKLAEKSISKLETKTGGKVNLIELNGYSRDQVNLLMNVSDCVLLTSFSEGSPQFIKEAMSCNCPIVTTNVGDVKWVLGNTEGCFITSFKPEDIAEKIKLAIEFRETHGHTRGRERIIELGLDSEPVAKKIIEVYEKVLNC